MDTVNQKKNVSVYHNHLTGALDEIRNHLSHVQLKYSVSYESIRDYLLMNEPHLLESMDMLEQECDSDIFGRLISGQADPADKKVWIDTINEWKQFVFHGIKKFENYVFRTQVA